MLAFSALIGPFFRSSTLKESQVEQENSEEDLDGFLDETLVTALRPCLISSLVFLFRVFSEILHRGVKKNEKKGLRIFHMLSPFRKNLVIFYMLQFQLNNRAVEQTPYRRPTRCSSVHLKVRQKLVCWPIKLKGSLSNGMPSRPSNPDPP